MEDRQSSDLPRKWRTVAQPSNQGSMSVLPQPGNSHQPNTWLHTQSRTPHHPKTRAQPRTPHAAMAPSTQQPPLNNRQVRAPTTRQNQRGSSAHKVKGPKSSCAQQKQPRVPRLGGSVQPVTTNVTPVKPQPRPQPQPHPQRPYTWSQHRNQPQAHCPQPYSIKTRSSSTTRSSAKTPTFPSTKPKPSIPPKSKPPKTANLISGTTPETGPHDTTPSLPAPFQSYENIMICDQFLLGYCPKREGCHLYHTQYPFHWQLKRTDTPEWVSLEPSSQLEAERWFCDPDKERVYLTRWTLKDQLCLNFVSLMVENSTVYSQVRRLSNTTDPALNPHFPTHWRFYWESDYGWEAYGEENLELILDCLSKGQDSCWLGKDWACVNLKMLTEKNFITDSTHRIRCRPTFRSPDSLKHHLRILPVGQVTLPSLEVDPMENFNCRYPPMWTLSPGNPFSMLEVPPGTLVYRTVHDLFHRTMPESQAQITSLQQVQNTFQWDKYRMQKKHMEDTQDNCSVVLERHLFHGTSESAAMDIGRQNFDPRVAKPTSHYGRGVYFAREALRSSLYSIRGPGGDFTDCGFMFLAKVLVGKACVGKIDYVRPPRLPNPTKLGRHHYDSCADQKHPTIFVVFDSSQCYPYYLINYKVLGNNGSAV
ncbi:hypothetical protein J4Q44_G00114110 [Coregonus suidteri]|uniref:Poly [ADP-ribose] polymerase n=1 Tax=Coregonus suidteri TaxID=861788 RepID=A0AAN8LTR3_9TELE